MIALSCIVFVLVVVIGVLIWRLRRTVANNRTTTSGKAFTDDVGQPDSPHDQHVSEPGSYMELHPRPLQEQLPAAPNYQALQGKNKAPEYYNVGFNKENKEKEDTEIYDEIGNAQCWVVSFHLTTLVNRPRLRDHMWHLEHAAACITRYIGLFHITQKNLPRDAYLSLK